MINYGLKNTGLHMSIRTIQGRLARKAPIKNRMSQLMCDRSYVVRPEQGDYAVWTPRVWMPA